MKVKTPLTKSRVRTHFTYNFWKYLVVAAAAIFAWNLIYTTTAYRSPEEKRIDLYIQSAVVTEERAAAFLNPIWHEAVPEMETVSAVMLLGNSQDYYAGVQLTVYIMAAEGDIYMLSTTDFKTYAAQDTFIDLTPYIESGRLDVSGLELGSGRVAVIGENGLPVGEKAQYGIPAYALSGFADGMGLDCRDIVIAVTRYNGNEENVITFLNAMIQAARPQAAGE